MDMDKTLKIPRNQRLPWCLYLDAVVEQENSRTKVYPDRDHFALLKGGVDWNAAPVLDVGSSIHCFWDCRLDAFIRPAKTHQ